MQDQLLHGTERLPSQPSSNGSTTESETMSDARYAFLFSFAAFVFFPIQQIAVQTYEHFDGQIHGVEALLSWSAIALVAAFMLFCTIRLARAAFPVARAMCARYLRSRPIEICSVLLPMSLAIIYSLYACAFQAEVFKDSRVWQYMTMLYSLPIFGLAALHLVRRSGVVSRMLTGLCNGLCAAIALSLGLTSTMIPGTSAFFASLNNGLDQFTAFFILVSAAATFSMIPLLAFLASFAKWRFHGVLSLFGRYNVVGFVVGLALVIAPTVPKTLTHMILEESMGANEAKQRAMVRFLRTFGDKEELLSHCYAFGDGADDPKCERNESLETCLNLIFQRETGSYVDVDWARILYYRVTGEPFNMSKAALGSSYDWEVGGTAVGGKIRGLALADSIIGGKLCAEDDIGTFEWTLVFDNPTSDAQEARAQIALPPGGVVSSAVLWVNGKPREALVAGRFAAREAYQNVVYGQRDPLLISDAGNDRVLLQCYPVAPHGKMKVRVDITFPVRTDLQGQEVANLPRFTETNFDLPKTQKLDIEVDEQWDLSLGNMMISDAATSARHRLISNVPITSFEKQFPCLVSKARVGPDKTSPRDANNGVKELVVVVDGATAVKPYVTNIVSALEHMPANVKTTFLIASDEISALAPDGTSRAMVLKALGEAPFLGGPSNLGALSKAIDLMDDGPDGAVLWIHGPQPNLYGDKKEVFAKLLCDQVNVSLFDFEVVSGPNKFAELLGRIDLLFPTGHTGGPPVHGVPMVKTVPRQFTVASDLKSFLSAWAADDLPVFMQPLSKHFNCDSGWSKLRAAREASRYVEIGLLTDATRVACEFGVVSPTSSAVVLETDAQYKQFGLIPSTAETTTKVLRMDGVSAFSTLGRNGSVGGGLVGAPVDPRFGQSNEVGMLADYGYDTARDVVRCITLLSSIVSLIWGLSASCRTGATEPSFKQLLRASAIIFGIPLGLHMLGMFIINNFGSIGGGL